LRVVVDRSPVPTSVVLASTGFCGRELYSVNDRPNHLYMVGSMGCVVPLALGLALARPDLRVIALDGDGAALMRMGAFGSGRRVWPTESAASVVDNGVARIDRRPGNGVCPRFVCRSGLRPAAMPRRSKRMIWRKWLHGLMLRRSMDQGSPALLTRASRSDDLPRPSIRPVDVKTRLMQHFAPAASIR